MENQHQELPIDIQTEEFILACLLIDKNSVFESFGKLKPEHFYSTKNQKIYQAIIDLNNHSIGIDMITVLDQLKKNKHADEIGGAVEIARLTSLINNPRNLIYYIDIIIDTYNLRELIRVLGENQEKCYDGEISPQDIMNQLEGEIYKLTSNNTKKEPQIIQVGLSNAVKNIEKFNDHELTGVPTPFSKLNTITGGWQEGDLIIIGGRPSQGKTQLAIECIMAASKSKLPTLFFSAEMSETAISTRFICHETGISNEYIRKGLTDDDWLSVEKSVGSLERLPIILDDTPSINLTELISKTKRAKIKHNIGLVVIDYLQLITLDYRNQRMSRDEKIGEMTKALKGLAKELKIPVILLSQLNRLVEMHSDKRPSLSNLRESGNSEQDADIVIFIHNPSYYKDPDYESEPNVLELIIGKHRNGRIGTIKINRKPEWTSLYDYSF